MLTQHKMREHGMEFKGVKLYKTSSRSRKHGSIKPEVDSTAAAVASIAAPPETAIVSAGTPVHQPHQSSSAQSIPNVSTHVLEHSHDSILSSESSQSHSIQQQQQQHQQSHHQQQQPLQYQHPVAAAQLERMHYPPGFVYAGLTGGAPPTMMLPPGGYNG